MNMFRAVVLAALAAPLAFGEYSYTYDYTDAPTASPTSSMAPTRTETYAPTRMTETPSYAPTTDTYAPTMAPTATAAPTYTVPTPRPTFTTECTAQDLAPLDEGGNPTVAYCYNTNEFVPGTNERGTCNATGTRDLYERIAIVTCEDGRNILADCSPTGANCTICGGDIDVTTGEVFVTACCNYKPTTNSTTC